MRAGSKSQSEASGGERERERRGRAEQPGTGLQAVVQPREAPKVDSNCGNAGGDGEQRGSEPSVYRGDHGLALSLMPTLRRRYTYGQ